MGSSLKMAVDNCPYPGALTNAEWEGSLRSARLVVPIVMRLVRLGSVLDVGCGWGSWLKAFQEHGVSVVRGFDGSWADQDRLLIDKRNFRTVDLTEPFEPGDRFDLAVCLEVAEHLPERAASRLIQTLTRAAPLVLFSAAIPGQGGHGHINEQWPEYWAMLYREHGFRRLDPIRRHVWQDDRIEWWYRQNLYLFASDEAIRNSVALRAEEQYTRAPHAEWIGKIVVDELLSRQEGLRNRYDDVTINLRLRQAGATLVSVSESIDDSPSGHSKRGRWGRPKSSARLQRSAIASVLAMAPGYSPKSVCICSGDLR